MADEIKSYTCSQCGSTDFENAGAKQVRCAHCGSLYEVLTDEPTLTIRKGANVVFGKNAKVEVHGEVEIEDGAKVDVNGKITLVQGKKKRKFKLVKKGDQVEKKDDPSEANKID